MRICRTCGGTFGTKRIKAGFIDQCDACSLRSRDHKKKYVGRPGATNKDASITIIKTDLDAARKQLRRENTCGYGANINLSSAAQERVKEQFLDPDD